MLKKQEWIRFYDGQVEEHPKVPGTYMRHGFGEQRWADGRVYRGQWQDHVYHGEGELWASLAEMERNEEVNERGEQLRLPIYKGAWSRGRKHGHGVLRWEQRTAEDGTTSAFVLGTGASQRRGIHLGAIATENTPPLQSANPLEA